MGQACGQENSQENGRGPGAIRPPPYLPEKSELPQLGRSAREKTRQPSAHDDPPIPLHEKNFKISVSENHRANLPKQRLGWKSCYALGRVLGDGISAKVYEAQALVTPQKVVSEEQSFWDCTSPPRNSCIKDRGRRVALKRFHRVGSRTFRKELDALHRIGVFPHVLRLLESFEGFDGEDVLVLEYCDGSTVYDLYAREHPHGGLPERLIVRLIRQLLLALEHLGRCGVEHQDVKPENMMLFDVSVSNGTADLKLGDFGWATPIPTPGAPGAHLVKPPANGAGSLWYAPPELNPQPGGAASVHQPGSLVGPGVPARPHSPGRCDMWSVGVVTYLLLVGHNPFNLALKLPTPTAVDSEVMRLAALGNYNKTSERWLRLNPEARDFVGLLLRVQPSTRAPASEALHHPFLSRPWAKTGETPVFFRGPVTHWADWQAWTSLDGLQRLGWLAMARAIAEPELERHVITSALEGIRASGGTSQSNAPSEVPREIAYLWELAREIATAPVNQWLEDHPAWAEVLRLAFCYLDIDGDGLLGPEDLVMHTQNVFAMKPDDGTKWGVICRWVSRWEPPDSTPTTIQGHKALTIEGFRTALLSSANGDTIFEGLESETHPSFVRDAEDEENPEDAEEEIAWGSLNRSGPGRMLSAGRSCMVDRCMK